MQPAHAQHSVPAPITVDEAINIADIFRLMGDPTRTRLLYTLLDRGEVYVSDLAAAIDASETTVSHALRLLRASHIVTARREGRRIAYALADHHVRQVLMMTRDHLDHLDTA